MKNTANRIGAVCLNPCIDMTVRTPNVVRGALNRARDVRFDYSGKGVNVAIVAARLSGVRSVLTGFMGKAHEAMYAGRLSQENVETRWVTYDGEVRTNIKLYETAEPAVFTEINSPGQTVSTEMKEKLFDEVERMCGETDMIVMSGSIPPGLGKDVYAELIRLCRTHGRDVLLDCDGEALKLGLAQHPLFIKPNRAELEGLVGKKLNGAREIIGAARSTGAGHVLVSDGSAGAYYVGKDKAYFCAAPKIEALTTTGAGDSLAVAAVLAYLGGCSEAEMLCRGVAAGSASCLAHGTELLDPENYANILASLEAITAERQI